MLPDPAWAAARAAAAQGHALAVLAALDPHLDDVYAGGAPSAALDLAWALEATDRADDALALLDGLPALDTTDALVLALARAGLRRRLGQIQVANALLVQVVTVADAIGDTARAALAAAAHAELLAEHGDPAEADEALARAGADVAALVAQGRVLLVRRELDGVAAVADAAAHVAGSPLAALRARVEIADTVDARHFGHVTGPIYASALADGRAAGSPDGVWLARALAGFATTAAAPSERAALREEAAAVLERAIGPHTLAYGALAVTLARTRPGDPTAVTWSRRGLDARRASLGDDHPDLGVAFRHHADAIARVDPDGALAALREAIARDERAFGPDHARTQGSREHLADLLVALRRSGDADPG